MTLLATIIDHSGAGYASALPDRSPPILRATVDDPDALPGESPRCALTSVRHRAFRTGDTVYVTGKLVHVQDRDCSTFGIELTPWNVSASYLANLTRRAPEM